MNKIERPYFQCVLNLTSYVYIYVFGPNIKCTSLVATLRISQCKTKSIGRRWRPNSACWNINNIISRRRMRHVRQQHARDQSIKLRNKQTSIERRKLQSLSPWNWQWFCVCVNYYSKSENLWASRHKFMTNGVVYRYIFVEWVCEYYEQMRRK